MIIMNIIRKDGKIEQKHKFENTWDLVAEFPKWRQFTKEKNLQIELDDLDKQIRGMI